MTCFASQIASSLVAPRNDTVTRFFWQQIQVIGQPLFPLFQRGYVLEIARAMKQFSFSSPFGKGGKGDFEGAIS
jgi:hypothetical protein